MKQSVAVYRFPVSDIFMIRSFREAETEKIFRQQFSKKFHGVEKTALRKLLLVHRAPRLRDLALFPANRLEKLTGDRQGQYSIRINDQYRICFTWQEGDAWNVEIIDYH